METDIKEVQRQIDETRANLNRQLGYLDAAQQAVNEAWAAPGKKPPRAVCAHPGGFGTPCPELLS